MATFTAIRAAIRFCLLISILYSVALLSATASSAADDGARQFAVRITMAQLHGKWGEVWQSMYPGQQKFIPRALFVRCKSKSKVQSAPARAVRAVSVSSGIAAIPGVRGMKVRISTVKVKVDYGHAVPSRTTAVLQARVNNKWYAINEAQSRRRFVGTNFCS